MTLPKSAFAPCVLLCRQAGIDVAALVLLSCGAMCGCMLGFGEDRIPVILGQLNCNLAVGFAHSICLEM